jgi:hypothetical protein
MFGFGLEVILDIFGFGLEVIYVIYLFIYSRYTE